jgi:hypothetical protein
MLVAATFVFARSGGSGGDAGPGVSATGPSGAVGAAGLTACPTTGPEKAGTAQIAAGYNGKVNGISCSAAGSYIVDSFIGGFHESLARQSGSVQHLIRYGHPDTYRSAGFECRHRSLSDESGWALACQRGAQKVAFTFTP